MSDREIYFFTNDGEVPAQALYDHVKKSWLLVGKAIYESSNAPYDENTAILNSMISHCVGIVNQYGPIHFEDTLTSLARLFQEMGYPIVISAQTGDDDVH